MVHGFGSDCAARLGLIAPAVRLPAGGQDGPTLMDMLDAEPEDCCDGWDR